MRSKKRKLARVILLHGLVVVLTLVGHDLLMASVTFAAPTALHASASSHHAGEVKTEFQSGNPSPAHPISCDTTGEAVVAAEPNRDAVAMGALATPLGDDARQTTTSAALRWLEPLWPPGTLRALLQVYRI